MLCLRALHQFWYLGPVQLRSPNPFSPFHLPPARGLNEIQASQVTQISTVGPGIFSILSTVHSFTTELMDDTVILNPPGGRHLKELQTRSPENMNGALRAKANAVRRADRGDSRGISCRQSVFIGNHQ